MEGRSESPPAIGSERHNTLPYTEKHIHTTKHKDALNTGLAHTAVLLGFFALVSRLLGLVRDLCMAWLLGGGAVADALVGAMRLPHVLRRLLGEGSLSMTLTASLVHLARQTQGNNEPDMRALAYALNIRLGAILCGLTILGMLAAPWLATLLAPGFDAAQNTMTVTLLRICLPYIPAAFMAALSMAFLHSINVFWLPAFSPVLFNCVILSFAGLGALNILSPAWALATGMTFGGIAQWLMQWLAVRHLLPGTAKRYPETDATKKHIFTVRYAWNCLRPIPAGMLGAAAPQIAMLLAMTMASNLGQGHMAALYYAERFLELPLGFIGVCLGMASLPALSRLAAQGAMEQFMEQLATALRLTLLCILPAIAGLWVVGPRLVEGMFCHGAFDDMATHATGAALLAYLPGLPALAVNRPLLAACNALSMTRKTAASTIASALMTLATGLVLLKCLPEKLTIMAPALAVNTGMWVQTGILLFTVHKALHAQGIPPNTHWLPGITQVLRQAVAAVAAGVSAWLLLILVQNLWTGIGLAIVGGITAWALVLLALHDADFSTLLVSVRPQRKYIRHD